MAEAAIRIGAINTDWTNRHPNVNTTAALAEDLAQRLRDKVPTVLTLSEVCAAKLLEEITKKVEHYEGVCHKLSYDQIVQLWDMRTIDLWSYIPTDRSSYGLKPRQIYGRTFATYGSWTGSLTRISSFAS